MNGPSKENLDANIHQDTKCDSGGRQQAENHEEFIGRVNSKTQPLSVARMRSPSGWVEPGQRPDFDEYTLVLRGMLLVTSKGEAVEVHAGQAIIAHRRRVGTVQHTGPEGAEYVAICLRRSLWRLCTETNRKVHWQRCRDFVNVVEHKVQFVSVEEAVEAQRPQVWNPLESMISAFEEMNC
jgi:quercetin dioxygenase-like cupin family protein